jgi:hypothetical protein
MKRAKWFFHLCISLGRLLLRREELKLPKDLKTMGLTDKLFSQPEPIFLKDSDDKYDFDLETKFHEWVECGELSNVRLFRKHPSCEITEGCDAVLCLDEIQCSYCKEKGTLTEKWPSAFRHCPSCEKRSIVDCGSWMT